MFLRDALVSWKSKKQNTVVRSSAEAEYYAIDATASEVAWLQQLLLDFQLLVSSVKFVYDN